MKSRAFVPFVLIVLSLVLAPVPGRADRWHAAPVAVQLPGDTANATSERVRLNSLDGRYTLFQSRSSHLVAGLVDENDAYDVFLHDRVAGTTQLVSVALGSTTVAADGGSSADAISADGRFIVLSSRATNLVAGVTGGTAGSTQLYLFDRVAGTATLVSHRFDSPTVAATGFAGEASISGDGQWVVYSSNSTDVINGSLTSRDVFLFDRVTGTNVLVSRSAASSTTGGNSVSVSPRISADGRWIAFESTANNLLASDTNGSTDVFLFDRFAGTVGLVSRQAGTSTTPANRDSDVTAISPDGQWVLFSSFATNLVAGVTDNALRFDVFVYDRNTGSTILASRPAGSTTTTPNGHSFATGISDDGARVIFESQATDLGFTDTSAFETAYVFDRNTAATTLVSRQRGTTTVAAAGFATPNAISPDGQMIVFTSNGDDLVTGIEDANGTPDVFLFNMATGITTLVSQAGSAARTGSGLSWKPSLGSGWIAFESEAQDLLDGLADRNASSDVFLRGPTGVRTLLSAGIGTPQTTLGAGSEFASMTGDARYVSFSTDDSSVVAGATDLNRVSDAFFFDRQTTTTSLVSSATGAPTTAANAPAESGPTSLDGRWVLYTSRATNVSFGQLEFNAAGDVFLLDRTTGASVLVSRSTNATSWTGNGASTAAELSADGRYAVFTSSATDLVAGVTDSNGKVDTFVFDRDTRATTLVSRSPAGTSTPNGTSVADTISPDGRWILYTITFQPPFDPASSDLYLFDRETATTTLVSHEQGVPTQSAGGASRDGFLSADGQWVLFTSTSTVLIANGTDTNAASDVFLFARSTGTVTLVSHASRFASTTADAPSTATGLSADGRWAVFHSGASNVAAGVIDDNGALPDAFVFDRTTGTSALVTRAVGTLDTTPNNEVTGSMISADGRWIAFSSRATNLVAATDANGEVQDSFVFDRTTGTTSLVSRAAATTGTANAETVPTAIGADGRWLLLRSTASNLGVRDLNGRYDAYLAEHRFDVVATAGPNGSIAPPATSGVPLGTSTAFTLAAATHYAIQSVTGCGGALAGQTYTTGPVDADCTVTAAFGNTAPTIGTVADVTVLEDSGTQTRVVTVADAETPLASLSLAAASAQPVTLPAPTVGAGATADQRVVAFAPAANRNGGPVAITLTLSDVPGASTTGSFAVTITPVNDAPTLAFAADPRHPQGTTGAQSRPAFASVDLGPDDEEANQSVEDFQIVAISDPSGILVPASLDIANNGTLVYALTGASGTAIVQANIRDNAGSQNGGQNVSATEVFSVVVEGTDLFANGFE